MSIDWATVATSMAGVLAGGGISLVTQRLSQRHADRLERRRQTVTRAESRRTERILLFDRLTAAAQVAERVAMDRHHGDLGGSEYASRASAATDRVWVEQKVLDVVSSPEVRRATFEFALALNHVVWEGPGEAKVWEFLDQTRDAVLTAARSDVAALDPLLPDNDRNAIRQPRRRAA